MCYHLGLICPHMLFLIMHAFRVQPSICAIHPGMYTVAYARHLLLHGLIYRAADKLLLGLNLLRLEL